MMFHSKTQRAVILLNTITLLGVCPIIATAQPAPPAKGNAADQGPIDIQANEQDFAGDQVLAKGNVRVKYQDSIVNAPQATLLRDALGNPQKAIFTGRSKLTQGNSQISADALTFEIADQKILAEGKAHSEVVSGGENNPNNKDSSLRSVEKIITDSDRQEYDKSKGKFEAFGHVHVLHGDISVHSEKLQLIYGTNDKPETALFTGHVVATQNKNNTESDSMTYSLTTKRLQASGHVRSKVIQEKREAPKKVSDAGNTNNIFAGQAAMAADLSDFREDNILISSEYQDYNKETGKLVATGKVKVFYDDTLGCGPSVIMTRNSEGKAEKVIFIGRSQITQPNKRWIADSITMTIADKKVLAQGNTRAIILHGGPGGAPGSSSPPAAEQTRLAGNRQAL